MTIYQMTYFTEFFMNLLSNVQGIIIGSWDLKSSGLAQKNQKLNEVLHGQLNF